MAGTNILAINISRYSKYYALTQVKLGRIEQAWKSVFNPWPVRILYLTCFDFVLEHLCHLFNEYFKYI